MKIFTNASLKKYNTFGLNYTADCIIHIRSRKEAKEIFDGTMSWQKPLLIVGEGSNILFTDDFKGTILYPDIRGIKIEDKDYNPGKVLVSAGAGVKWDDFVEWTVNMGFGGAENLSLIPGKVGATPVQNIGAYGVEVNNLIVKAEAISTIDGSIRIFTNEECGFGYRNSTFKNSEKGKYLITRVFYCLRTSPVFDLSYESLKDEVNKLGGVTLRNVRQAIISIRRSKLPDPEFVGNAGSFFKNSIVLDSVAEHLKKNYPNMPLYADRPGYKKLASGWLIDHCGWKGKRRGDAGVHEKQALVIINYGKASGKEIYELSEEIRNSVFQKFGVDMEREAEVIGTI